MRFITNQKFTDVFPHFWNQMTGPGDNMMVFQDDKDERHLLLRPIERIHLTQGVHNYDRAIPVTKLNNSLFIEIMAGR
jgi:hypothetical protein